MRWDLILNTRDKGRRSEVGDGEACVPVCQGRGSAFDGMGASLSYSLLVLDSDHVASRCVMLMQ